MGKNRSFVSQICNPAYPVPIPLQHLNTIFEVCHFSPQAKAAFLRAYARAHPRRIGRVAEGPHERTLTLHLPDLGNARRNAQLDTLLQEFAQRLTALMRDNK
jgi:nitroreductase